MATRRFEIRRLLGLLFSFLILAALLALFFAYQRQVRISPRPLTISIRELPYYAFCSFYRMLIAYLLSLIFAISYGLAAARSRLSERIMMPAIDIAQSVPVIGFFPAAIYFFVALTGGSRLGVEMAAIFLIFTSQAWNMAFGVFEAVKSIPGDSLEVIEAFGVTGWLRRKRLLLPVSVPRLVYNSMLSWAAGWYFLIACEIISLGPAKHYRLPGLGSFLMDSADKGAGADLAAGLLTLLAIIVTMDFLIWQPLSAWAEKFRYEFAASSEPMGSLGLVNFVGSLGLNLGRHLRRVLVRPIALRIEMAAEALSSAITPAQRAAMSRAFKYARTSFAVVVLLLLCYGVGRGLVDLFEVLMRPWPPEARQIPIATAASVARLVTAYAISLAWTLPCALAASESARFGRILVPFAEIAGAVPATALFPLIVVFVIQVTGGMNLASILLILTGMQWYLLFNLMSGVRLIPEDLKEATRSFGLTRVARWRKLVIPALFPSLITGSITAWGGGWNALILSEYFVYHDHHYKVMGLGALLDQATYETGNSQLILLSLLSMVLVVMTLNRIVWRRLYSFTTERFRFDY
jgi:NitT/TauT family transport system permease protein